MPHLSAERVLRQLELQEESPPIFRNDRELIDVDSIVGFALLNPITFCCCFRKDMIKRFTVDVCRSRLRISELDRLQLVIKILCLLLLERV